jgi:hypothetical protein
LRAARARRLPSRRSSRQCAPRSATRQDLAAGDRSAAVVFRLAAPPLPSDLAVSRLPFHNICGYLQPPVRLVVATRSYWASAPEIVLGYGMPAANKRMQNAVWIKWFSGYVGSASLMRGVMRDCETPRLVDAVAGSV